MYHDSSWKIIYPQPFFIHSGNYQRLLSLLDFSISAGIESTLTASPSLFMILLTKLRSLELMILSHLLSASFPLQPVNFLSFGFSSLSYQNSMCCFHLSFTFLVHLLYCLQRLNHLFFYPSFLSSMSAWWCPLKAKIAPLWL